MDSITLKAYAKVNLGLDVTGRRPDGYHEIRTVMQTVGLFDSVTVSKSTAPGIKISSDSPLIPADEKNTAYAAARLIADEAGIKDGLEIDIKKHIPVAAGLAGGSADAAAVLRGINVLYDLKMSADELMRLAVRVGADVPYCIMRGTALAEGIGEILTPVTSLPACLFLIAMPKGRVSTAGAYGKLDTIRVKRHPDIDGLISAISSGDLKRAASFMANVFEEVTKNDLPVIGDIKRKMLSRGAFAAVMSGSGPSVFGIFEDERSAGKAREAVESDPRVRSVFAVGDDRYYL